MAKVLLNSAGKVLLNSNGKVLMKADGTNLVSITLNPAEEEETEGYWRYVKIKFGSAPTSDSDYDYIAVGTNRSGIHSDVSWDPPVSNPITVPAKAFIWADEENGSTINQTSISSFIGSTYSSADEITLNNNDVLTLKFRGYD